MKNNHKNILRNNKIFREYLGKQIVKRTQEEKGNPNTDHWLITLDAKMLNKTVASNNCIEILFSKTKGIFYKTIENTKTKITKTFSITLIDGSQLDIIDGQMA